MFVPLKPPSRIVAAWCDGDERRAGGEERRDTGGDERRCPGGGGDGGERRAGGEDRRDADGCNGDARRGDDDCDDADGDEVSAATAGDSLPAVDDPTSDVINDSGVLNSSSGDDDRAPAAAIAA